jgi:hypothetical protein
MTDKACERRLLVLRTLELLIDEALGRTGAEGRTGAWWYPGAAAAVAPSAVRLEALRAQLHCARTELEEQLAIGAAETEQGELEAAV